MERGRYVAVPETCLSSKSMTSQPLKLGRAHDDNLEPASMKPQLESPHLIQRQIFTPGPFSIPTHVG